MNREQTLHDYHARVDRVQTFIHEHLDEDLDLDRLADVAAFSHYHWHRIYHGITGETVVQTVRRLRLHRASADLIRSSDDIVRIAKRAGYGSVEAFSRAFRAAFGEPPVSFRNRSRPMSAPDSQAPSYPETPHKRKLDMYDVEVKDLPAFKLAAVEHHGDYMGIGQAFEAVMTWAGKKGLLNGEIATTGIYYHDPKGTPVEDLRSDAGVRIQDSFPDDQTDGGKPVRTLDVPGGRHAVLLFKGPYAELEKPYTWLFGTWLPESGEEAADHPAYENYLNDTRVTPPNELLTEICLPLK